MLANFVQKKKKSIFNNEYLFHGFYIISSINRSYTLKGQQYMLLGSAGKINNSSTSV